MKKIYKKIMSSMWAKIGVGIFVLIVAGAIYYSAKSEANATEVVAAKIGSVTQEVEVSGKTKPISSVDLAFEKSGKVASVGAQVGDKVAAGQVIVSLSRADALAGLAQARANLLAEQARLDEMMKGTRTEQLDIYTAQSDSAKTSLEDAKRNLSDKIKDAYTKSDDSVKNHTDQFFSKNSYSPSFEVKYTDSSGTYTFYPTDMSKVGVLNTKRYALVSLFPNWKSEIDAMNSDSDFEKLAADSQANISQVKDFADYLADVVNSFSYDTLTQQSVLSGYRADLSGVRANLNLAVSNLTSALEAYRSAKSGLEVANRELVLQKAGSTPEALASEEARVAQLEAQVDGANAELSKTVIISPIDGILTKQEAKVGEIVNSGVVVSSVISEGNLEIEGYVPEVNVGKVSVGNVVEVDFDAFSGEKFSGKIEYVEPAETMVDGVVNYKIKVLMDQNDSKLRSGLTANLKIVTASKEGVLLVPKFAVFEKGGKKFVSVTSSGDLSDAKNVEVVLGISGDNGVVEIVSGLKEGDLVVVKN